VSNGATAGTALFDLDGTLTDPAEGITACIRHGLAAVDVDADKHGPLERFIGPPLNDSFAGLGLTPDQVDEAITAYRERFAIVGMFENEVYDGIPELLRGLTEARWTLAVATSKPDIFAVKILEHFELRSFFEVVAGATMTGTRRTKVDVLKHALAELGPRTSADRMIMIGDRRLDIDAAHACGIGSIGVLYGYGSPEELIPANPSALANSPEEVGTLLGL